MRILHTLRITLLISATACGGAPTVVDEATFEIGFSETYCERLEECAEGFFYSEFRDQDDCFREISGIQDDYIDDADNFDCDFELDEAQECTTITHESNCESFWEFHFLGEDVSEYDACTEIFDC